MSVYDTPVILVLKISTLPRLLWLLARKKRIAMVMPRPAVDLERRICQSLMDLLLRSRRIIDPWEFPELSRCRGFRIEAYYSYYMKVEPWIREVFRFDKSESDLADYAQAYRHTVFGHVDRYSRAVFLITALRRRFPNAPLVGADELLQGLLASWSGFPSCRAPFRLPLSRSLSNLLLAAATLVLSLSAIAVRLRVRPLKPEPVLLGAPYCPDPRNAQFLRELVSPSEIRTIFLDASDFRADADNSNSLPHCWIEDGVFSTAEAASAACLAIRDLSVLWWCLKNRLPPSFFRGVAGLVWRRIRWRALFGRYRFQAVWGRDDYSADHIMRTIELRRIGGKSLGINHGLPTTDIVEPGWRYIDFDIYYVFGRHLYDRYYRDSWPARMAVVPVGSFGMTRSQLNRVKFPRPPDFVYFVNPGPFEEEQSRVFVDLASRFPDRTFWVKIKSTRKRDNSCRITVSLLSGAPKNVCETEVDTYELMLRARYALAALSTVAAEAIQFGLVTFILDLHPNDMVNYFRDFPDLCYNSAEVIERRVRAIESGQIKIDHTAFADLIDLSGKVIHDVVRADLGLSNPATTAPHDAGHLHRAAKSYS